MTTARSQAQNRHLRRATRDAQSRCARVRASIDRRQDRNPRPGDLLGFAETAEHAVLWAVLEVAEGPDQRQFRLVAADLHPWVGTYDVEVPAESPCGALSLRCGFEAQLDGVSIDSYRCVGVLEPRVLAQARRKRTEIESGKITGSVLEREVDDELDYQDWMRDHPEAARTALLASVG